MELTSPKVIKELLAKYGTAPNKTMGQNFLINKNALNKIIDASELKNTDTVLEVGPGIGVLTQELALRAKKVIAIEKDPVMLNILEETVSSFKNIEVIQADILKFSITNSQFSNYKVVANIPYYLTSHLIRHFLEAENPPTEIILMIQKEVAQRICAKPPNMSILAISVQFYAATKIISYVSKGCFLPIPRVDSAIIKIVPFGWAHSDFASREASEHYSDAFFKVVKAGFSQPRKQLAGNFSKILKKDKKEITQWLLQNNIQPEQRAETLSVEDWQNLTHTF